LKGKAFPKLAQKQRDRFWNGGPWRSRATASSRSVLLKTSRASQGRAPGGSIKGKSVVPADEIKEIQPTMTMVPGKAVWDVAAK
jgi:hypothetical protein